MVLRHTSQWDHPRLRGEYLVGNYIVSRLIGSPPLARGVLTDIDFSIIEEWDHPRLRGEYL